MKNKKNFFTSLKEKTLKSPPDRVDSTIKNFAESETNSAEKTFFPKWLLTGAVVSACLVLFLARIPMNQMQQQSISESPELIAHYDSIELMADSSELSEEDWEEIALKELK